MTIKNIMQAADAAACQPDTNGTDATPEEKADDTAGTPANSPAAGEQEIEDRAAQDGHLLWLAKNAGYWRSLLPPDISEDRFNLSAWAVMDNASPAMVEAIKNNWPSLIYSLSMCAHFGLMPDGIQAALVPVKGKVEFWPMYRGYVGLALRTGAVRSITFDLVREGEVVALDKGKPAPDDFTHIKNIFDDDAPPLAAYAYAWLPDGSRTEVVTMSIKKVKEHRDKYSKAYQRAEREKKYDSPWHTSFDAMMAKTVFHQLVKRLNLVGASTERFAELIQADVADVPDSFGRKPVVPARVRRVLSGQNLASIEAAPGDGRNADPVAVAKAVTEATVAMRNANPYQPHVYVYDKGTDPTCGIEGCDGYPESPIHIKI